MGESTRSPCRNRSPLRNAMAILAILAVLTGGMLLRRSGLANSMVESAIYPPIVSEAPPPDYIIQVIDERGQPVPSFQVMIQTAGQGVTMWQSGAAGQVTFSGYQSTHYRDQWAIDALVRADGYAGTIARFEGPDREALFAGKATITLQQGEEVALRFRLPEGLRLPADLTPEVYLPGHRDAVRIMWNPDSRRAYEGHMPDFNFLNVKRSAGGRFAFRIDRTSGPFYVAVHHPGFLQFFESEPLTTADITNGILEIGLPKPASLDVRFDPGPETGERAFEDAWLTVDGNVPLTRSFFHVTSQNGGAGGQQLQVFDLAPGNYRATVMTRTKRAGQESLLSPGHSRVYRDSSELRLSAGETRRVNFRYAPFDPNVFRGVATARIRILNSDGSPAAGRPIKVTYRDPRHGDVEVFTGQTSQSGECEIRGITELQPESQSSAVYGISMEEQRLGDFRFAKNQANESFTFHLAPRVGDVVPNIDLVNVSTGVRSNLHDLRGKVVCLELWATWCGPCQGEMEKLNRIAAEHRALWRDRVAIVPVSIDEQPETVSRHVKQRAWDQVDHYWSGSHGARGWDAPAMRALVGQAVPETLILDRDGRILWRGHPADKPAGKDIADRINDALGK
jgi:thiol-disulfide isomerase/thioredoxin